jgi:ABC-type transport system involved in multi-copper enzyme maturation permease subunit
VIKLRAFLETLNLADRLENPILLMELRGAFRRRRFLYLLTSLLGLLGIVVLGTTSLLVSTEGETTAVGRYTFLAFFGVLLLLVLLVFPAISCTTIVEERLRKSYDLLVMTRLRAGHIVLGKLLAGLVYGFTFVVGTAPLVAITFLYGGVTPGQITLAFLFLGVVSVVASTYGVMISTLAKSSARAMVRTFVLLPFVCLLTLAPLAQLAMILLVGPLFRDHTLTKAGQAFLALDGLSSVLIWTGSLGWAAFWSALFFLVAANQIKPPVADRTTGYRIWFVAFSLFLGGIFGVGALNTPLRPYESGWSAATFVSVSVVVFSVGSVAFVAGGASLSRHAPRLTGVRRIVGVGAPSGAGLVMGVALVVYLSAIAVFTFGVEPLPAGTRRGATRSAEFIARWGAASSLCFLFALTQGFVLLTRLTRRPGIARGWATFLLVVPTAYAMLWYHFDGSGAKGNLYKGYAFSPYTVTISVHQRLNPRRRQLFLFGPAGAEVEGLIADRMEPMRGRGASGAELNAARRSLLAAYARSGLPVHEASTLIFLLFGGVLLLLNLRAAKPSLDSHSESDTLPSQ